MSLRNEFEISGTMKSGNALKFMQANKRFFIGAHRGNFTGSVSQSCNSKISSNKYVFRRIDGNMS